MTEEVNCFICGDILNDNNKYKLRCNHEYHYICLIEALKSKLNYNGKMKRVERCCPYCRYLIPPLPYKDECGEHVPGIHRMIHSQSTLLTTSSNISIGVCKNGQNCKFKAKYNGYCGHHKAAIIT